MDDSQSTPPREEPRSGSSEAWREVGSQFQVLGESLARAFRTAWEDEETRRQVKEMQNGLESMVQQVGQAMKDTVNSPTGQQVHSEAKRAAESFRTAGEQTAQEVRPHLVTALKDVNQALQTMIDRMEQRKTEETPEPPEAPGE